MILRKLMQHWWFVLCSSKIIKYQMPGAMTSIDDQYLAVQFAVDNMKEVTYVGSISAIYDEKVHHIIVHGCSNKKPDTKIGPTSHFRCSASNILFAWALNAGELVLPQGAAIPIGGHSNVNVIQLEVHYKDKFDGKDFITGVQFKTSKNVPDKLVGIFLLGAYNMYLPPKEWTNVHVTCPYYWQDDIEVFAYRTHAHSNGRVITGYIRRNNKFEMIGKGNPLWPHAFFTRVGGPIKLKHGDDVIATCRYYNSGETPVVNGAGRTNEMCNLYLMYTTPFRYSPLKSMSCWGAQSAGLTSDALNKLDVEELAPYPGYAGSVSATAIKNGWPKPVVPEEMIHSMNHHHIDDEDKSEDSNNINKSNAEIGKEQLKMRFKSIRYNSTFNPSIVLGEVAGVDTDVDGSVWVFHRANRTWNMETFNSDNIAFNTNPIPVNVVHQFDADGKLLSSWGAHIGFLMPHGLTVHGDHIWLTDVATHQIYKFTKGGDLLLTIGVQNIPGVGEYVFCKPTDVYIDSSNDEIYVADGYCNQRVVRYDAEGTFLDEIKHGFHVVHDIAEGPGDEILISDRENGRLCVWNKASRLMVKIYNSAKIGPRIFASVYSSFDSNIYLVNGASRDQLHGAGIVMDAEQNIEAKFGVSEQSFLYPHDIAISKDGQCIYVAQISPHRLFKFHVNGDDIGHGISIFESITTTQIGRVATRHPLWLLGIVLTLVVFICSCVVVKYARKKRKPTKTYVYRPLLTNEEESDADDIEIYSRAAGVA